MSIVPGLSFPYLSLKLMTPHRTQQDLANELGVSSAAVSKWERGIGFPDVSLIEPLAASLG
ncbi:helix-turn-helix transcriptional regulator, partial [Lachnospiraceae bacterium 29-84]